MNPLKVLCLTVCVLTGITTTFSEYMTQTISVDDKKMKISEYAFDKYPILKSFYKDQYFIDRIQNTSQCKVIFNHLKKSVQNFIEDLKKGIYTEKKDSENIRLIFMKIIDHINNKLHYGLQMDDYFLEYYFKILDISNKLSKDTSSFSVFKQITTLDLPDDKISDEDYIKRIETLKNNKYLEVNWETMPENSIERYPILNIGFNYEISYFSDQTFDIESMFEALVKSVNSLKQDIEHEKIDIHNMSAIKIYLYRFYDLLKVRVDNMIGMENTDKSTKKTEFEIKEELRKKYELKIEQDKNYITEIVKELKELKNEMNNLFIAKESEKKAKM